MRRWVTVCAVLVILVLAIAVAVHSANDEPGCTDAAIQIIGRGGIGGPRTPDEALSQYLSTNSRMRPRELPHDPASYRRIDADGVTRFTTPIAEVRFVQTGTVWAFDGVKIDCAAADGPD